MNHLFLYWTSTSFLSLILLWSSYTFLYLPSAINGLKDLAVPDYLRIELAVLKILAAILLIVPQVPLVVKEWAYAGAFFFFITGIIAHWVHKDPIYINIINIIFIFILALSRFYFNR